MESCFHCKIALKNLAPNTKNIPLGPSRASILNPNHAPVQNLINKTLKSKNQGNGIKKNNRSFESSRILTINNARKQFQEKNQKYNGNIKTIYANYSQEQLRNMNKIEKNKRKYEFQDKKFGYLNEHMKKMNKEMIDKEREERYINSMKKKKTGKKGYSNKFLDSEDKNHQINNKNDNKNYCLPTFTSNELCKLSADKNILHTYLRDSSPCFPKTIRTYF